MQDTPTQGADDDVDSVLNQSEPEVSYPAKSKSWVIQTLRWIAVLPAAVGAFFAIQLLILLMDATMAEGRATWFLQLINSFAGAYAFVFAGAHTAPKHQFIVGIVLAVVLSVFLITLPTLAFFIKTTDPFWWIALASIVSLVAVIAAIIQLREDKWNLS
jgi:hypothetical protein